MHGCAARAAAGNVGVPAPASVPEFLVKVIAEKFRLDLHAAPYRGSAPMMADMLGNQIAAGVGTIPDFIENHNAGKIRVVGVMGRARQAVVPDVPTFAELGPGGFEDVPYYGLFAPAGTPQAAIDRFGAASPRWVAKPPVRERLTTMGLAVGHMGAAAAGSRERAYTAALGEASSRPPDSCRSDGPPALARGFVSPAQAGIHAARALSAAGAWRRILRLRGGRQDQAASR